MRLAELREAHPGWTIWWGKHTQSWWAAPPPGLAYSLLNDTSLDSLEATILDVESWSGG